MISEEQMKIFKDARLFITIKCPKTINWFKGNVFTILNSFNTPQTIQTFGVAPSSIVRDSSYYICQTPL